jgi:hypothetical protein
MSLSSAKTATISPQDFLSISELHGLVKRRDTQRFADWQQWSLNASKDPRLIAYYTFKHLEDDRWDRLVKNVTEPRHPQRAGGAVGASWSQGRWPEKTALEFKRPGDRVRLNLDGTYQALTLACWVSRIVPGLRVSPLRSVFVNLASMVWLSMATRLVVASVSVE